ncbi:hypothetical protein SAMN05192555_101214 [Franzmannia pantelleriensis]|uniref:O-Antigen ligase n=1 Tax=Franzmannia pantelleriensis TaxID=48727 RepID=A0A1G9ESM0_9GAMM|nr:hypothetical protein [Halomonas pantelleriensis]SDK79166.1 hypothetical protein SAMN05192555_101214 [Halomonas pantelleriensis]
MISYVLLSVAVVTLAGLFYWVVLDPVRGLYLAFLASGILNTIPLGPLREKVGLTEFVMALTWAAMLVNRKWLVQRVPFLDKQKLAVGLLCLFIVAYLASFFINNATFYDLLTESFVESFNIIYVAMMMVTVVLLVQKPEQWKGCLTGWLVGAAVVALVGLWAMTGSAPVWTYDEFSGRVSSTLRFENQVPSYLVPIMLIAMVWSSLATTSKWLRLLLLLLITAMVITLIGTGSRTALILVVLSILCMIGLLLVKHSNTSLLSGYLSLAIIGCGVSLFLYVAAALSMYDGQYSLGTTPSWQRPVIVLFESSQSGVLDTTRSRQAEIVIASAHENFFIGNGPKLYGAKYRMEEVHNTYAGVFFESGAFGVLALFAFIIAVIYNGFSGSRSNALNILTWASVVAFMLLLLYGMTMYGLRQRTLWLMCGLLVSVPNIVRYMDRSVYEYPMR